MAAAVAVANTPVEYIATGCIYTSIIMYFIYIAILNFSKAASLIIPAMAAAAVAAAANAPVKYIATDSIYRSSICRRLITDQTFYLHCNIDSVMQNSARNVFWLVNVGFHHHTVDSYTT